MNMRAAELSFSSQDMVYYPKMLSSFTNALKQRALEAALKTLINQKIKAFGSVTTLQIDTKQRTISAQLALKGETQPITINIGAYEVTQEKEITSISFQNLQASREWIGNVLNEYVAGRRFKVPGVVKMAL
jgi:hypothetical protein